MSYTLTITYNALGGSGGTASQTLQGQTSGSGIAFSGNLTSSKPTRTHYNFLGWSSSSSASVATWASGGYFSQTYGVAANYTITLYAVWQRKTAYVWYNANGGTGAPPTFAHDAGTSVTLSSTIPTRSGYTFLGWALSETATEPSYYPGVNYGFTENVQLFAVWRQSASTISTTDGVMATAQTITITRINNSYTDTIRYSFGNMTGAIVTKTSETSISWTPLIAFATQIPNATSGTCALTVTTYDGDTELGSNTIYISLSVPSTVKVGVSSVTLTETVEGIASTFGGFVQLKSKLQVTVTENTSYSRGATVTAYSININGQSLTENNAITSELLNSGTLAYSVTITDTRGRSSTYNGTYNVIPYSQPTISATAERDASTQSTVNVAYAWMVSAANNTNTKSIKIYTKAHDATSWVLVTTITPATYSGSATYAVTGTTATVSTDVRLVVDDYFTSAEVVATVAAYGARYMHFSASDGTVVFGGYNNSDG